MLACTLSLLALPITPANAADPSKQTMVYEVYAGGIHAVQATLDIEIKSNNRFNAILMTKTRGLLAKLAPWEGSFETKGWIFKDGHMRPEQHISMAKWRGDLETKDYAYAKDGTFKSITIDEHDKEPYQSDVDKKVTDGTTDAITATLLMLENYNETGKCEGSSLVFDGKRSFDQNFVHQKATILKSSKYNIYDGEAAECTVEVTPKEGKWYEKPRGWFSIQEQGREKGLLPTVWIAKMEDDAPAIPVKIRVKTDYGVLFMHLAEYQKGDKILVADKRVLEE